MAVGCVVVVVEIDDGIRCDIVGVLELVGYETDAGVTFGDCCVYGFLVGILQLALSVLVAEEGSQAADFVSLILGVFLI